MVAGVGLEPHGLRVMSPTSYQLLYPAIYKKGLVESGAGHRVRTGTKLSFHRILSPGRLPIPPLRHIAEFRMDRNLKCLIIISPNRWVVNTFFPLSQFF